MEPEYPPWFNIDAEDMQVMRDERSIFVCEMRRLGAPCGNETHVIALYRQIRGGFVVLPVCLECNEENGKSGEETTVYWRDKQREWGVR